MYNGANDGRDNRMIATQNQQVTRDEQSSASSIEFHSPVLPSAPYEHKSLAQIASSLLIAGKIVKHHPKAGLNPIVDAAGYLLSALGKLKHIPTYQQLAKLQKELIQEVNQFQETVKHLGYSTEYIVVCRYVICAAFDDIIANTAWGGEGAWENYYLLAAFNQDVKHHDKFFTIMERSINDPTSYIDLMELMYICLSMGYKGQYRATEYSQFQLEQITNNLYKHIRAKRGSFSKALSPTPLKSAQVAVRMATQNKWWPVFLCLVTACIIMAIFVSLGYLMDIIANEAFKNISQLKNPVTHQLHR